MNNNQSIGTSIKKLALVLFVVLFILELIGGMALITSSDFDDDFFSAGVAMVITNLVGIGIGCIVLYGFGELVESIYWISKPHRPKENYNTFSQPSKEQLDVLKQNYELTSGYDQTDEQPIGRHAAKPNNKAPQ